MDAEQIAQGIVIEGNREKWTNAQLRDAISTALREYGSKCPECEVKSLAQYQDKYGIDETEWTKEQAIKAMRMIHYDRMDLLRQIKQADAEGFMRGYNDGFHDGLGFTADSDKCEWLYQTSPFKAGYRCATNECANLAERMALYTGVDVANAIRELQRGTGGGE